MQHNKLPRCSCSCLISPLRCRRVITIVATGYLSAMTGKYWIAGSYIHQNLLPLQLKKTLNAVCNGINGYMKKYQTLLYYCYSHIDNAEQFAADHLHFCKSLGLVGRIIVADEGLNGTVSGTHEACEAYMDAVHRDPRFADTDFKIDEVHELSFIKMHCRYKSEIVHSGLRDPKVIDPTNETGKHLAPKEFMEMKDRDDVVILDVRSNYEHNVGRFKNAVTLDIENFREFPEKINELAQYKDKKVLTYCTGGIKCEKASALLLKEGFNDVYQLHGGIIKYGKEVGGKDFEGKCYVFDNRVTVDVNRVNPTVVSRCLNCGTTTSRMVNCANPECNEHFTQCEACGWELEGCCSNTCMSHPRKRSYDGTGYYVKVPQPVNVEKISKRKHKSLTTNPTLYN